MTNPSINYVETTGPVTRVGVLNDDEERAIEVAEELIGHECAWADATDFGFEVVFERHP
jgi:hypothetical protein